MLPLFLLSCGVIVCLWAFNALSKKKLSKANRLSPTRYPSKANIPILNRQQVLDTYRERSWQRIVYQDFEDKLLAKGTKYRGPVFPCVFATIGHRSDQHRFLFLDSSDPSEACNVRLIGPALHEYLRDADEFGPLTSLVVFSSPSPPDQLLRLEDYTRHFWSFLRELRAWDRGYWPENIPKDVEDPAWRFHFGGEPILPLSLHPDYEKRHSRRASTHTIILQSWRLLNEVVGTPEKGAMASGKVRPLLKQYDDIPICPDLKSHLDGTAFESHMLCLFDENTTSRCPWPRLE